MSLLPTDLASFVWGAVLGVVGAFFTGFSKKAGEDAYRALHAKLFPPPAPPLEVHRHFEPKLFKPGGCAWVEEFKVPDYEHEGYTHYPHESGAPKCFRTTYDGHRSFKEFLMVRPDAQKAA